MNALGSATVSAASVCLDLVSFRDRCSECRVTARCARGPHAEREGYYSRHHAPRDETTSAAQRTTPVMNALECTAVPAAQQRSRSGGAPVLAAYSTLFGRARLGNGGEERRGLLLRESLGCAPHVCREPIRKGSGMDLVLSRSRMNFPDGRKPLREREPRPPTRAPATADDRRKVTFPPTRRHTGTSRIGEWLASTGECCWPWVCPVTPAERPPAMASARLGTRPLADRGQPLEP